MSSTIGSTASLSIKHICRNDSINFVLASCISFKACHACKCELASMFACTSHKRMLMSPTRSISSLDTNRTYVFSQGQVMCGFVPSPAADCLAD